VPIYFILAESNLRTEEALEMNKMLYNLQLHSIIHIAQYVEVILHNARTLYKMTKLYTLPVTYIGIVRFILCYFNSM